MGKLFRANRIKSAISKYLKNIFESGELDENSVHSILEYTAADGKFYQTNMASMHPKGYNKQFFEIDYTPYGVISLFFTIFTPKRVYIV